MKPAVAVCLLALAAFTADDPPVLPDPAMTPGAMRTTDAAAVCRPGYARSARHVSRATKRRVYREYGIRHHPTRSFEIDHRVPLEVGGSNALRNLWPESYLMQPYNAHRKDRLENAVHEAMCYGSMTIGEAQAIFLGDWTVAYDQFFGKP